MLIADSMFYSLTPSRKKEKKEEVDQFAPTDWEKTVSIYPWELMRDDMGPSEELTGIHARAFELQTQLWINHICNDLLEEDRLDELAETDWDEYIYSTPINEDLL